MTPRLGLRTSHERTLESLYQRHAADVYRYALMMLGSATDAEDVTQTTFLNAYRALLRGERPRSTGTWLRTIAHNLCLQHFRQASRRPREVELEDGAPEQLASDQEPFLVEDLSRALRQIPVNQRAALLMRELEGRPIAEIAGILGVSSSAVETLLFRARRGVREQLEGGLTCAEAEQAISRQLDGDLKRSERGALRAHLRECEECAQLARSLRAQRGAIRGLAAIPLPGALAWSKFGTGAAASSVAAAGAGPAATGGAWVAGSLASKLVGAALAGVLASGVGYVAAVTHPWTGSGPVAKTPVRIAATEQPGTSAPIAGRTSPSPSPALRFTTARRAGGQEHKGGPSLRRVGAATKTTRSHAATVSASAGHPGTSQTTHGHGAGTGSSHAKHSAKSKRASHRTHPAHPTQPAHPAKPTHPTHPAQPAQPTHPAKPSQPAAPTQVSTPTTTSKQLTPPRKSSTSSGG
ncbi:MAG TPA: sigma-70 family RNA polymerase sigma factor [Solirubrobacteraceae bacterium]|jgi:RNA polymerase sigma factor (sigma-70 family)|nr:sigma-70 family RNA polymerase sigma factor [Solirubrobacteraceae bacterium]